VTGDRHEVSGHRKPGTLLFVERFVDNKTVRAYKVETYLVPDPSKKPFRVQRGQHDL
jgi:hypothetical protein